MVLVLRTGVSEDRSNRINLFTKNQTVHSAVTIGSYFHKVCKNSVICCRKKSCLYSETKLVMEVCFMAGLFQ